eukprot:4559702-Pyramimonas_sp.AAC.1
MRSQLSTRLANAFFQSSEEQLAASYKAGCRAARRGDWRAQPQIDYVACGQSWAHNITSVSALPGVPLSSTTSWRRPAPA